MSEQVNDNKDNIPEAEKTAPPETKPNESLPKVEETMETDTLYWDRGKKEIFTDCYVRLFSNDGFMQGYGMRSDEMARDVVLYKPFNSFAVVVQDTTKVIIDSVNFVGPLLKK